MKIITRNTLLHIISKTLFSKVGQPLSNNVTIANSWEEAVNECSKLKYIELKFAAGNQLTSAIHHAAKDVYNLTWNNNVVEIKSFIIPFVTEQVERLRLSSEVTSVIRNAVGGDLIDLGLEAEYSEYVKPGFFAGLSYWYDQGHFPCGWQGEYPQGKLMVF